MFNHLRGELQSVTPTNAIVEVNGVGYNVLISLNTFTAIKLQKNITLLVHQIIREDAHELFGFASEDERILFRQLISVSGVGASTARMILSSMLPEDLRSIIASGDSVTLQRIKGIGTKTAQRIIVDLKDKVFKGVPEPAGLPSVPHNTVRIEALSALLTLGFGRPNAEKAIDKVMRQTPGLSVEEAIKTALAML